MNITDYLVIAAILISAAVGSVRGFLREAIALVTWIIALFLAWHFSDLIAPHLGGLLAGAPVSTWAARIIIVVLLLLLGTGIGVAVAHFVRLSIFNGMDRFLGFLFGAFRGFVLLGVFVILGQLLRLDGEHWWRKSVLMPYGESIANGLRAVVGDHGERHASSDRGFGAWITNDHLLRPPLVGIFLRSFPLHGPHHARETIAESCSTRVALATAIVGYPGSNFKGG